TQAVKNAQDGISMVQTFEGALTETDSILQRMKTLANQMANGSYDDPVDRTAAQQEFLQLNDELDQIADTDFNGVVVLNGGKMSDGTMANGISVSVDSETGLTKKTYDTNADKAGLIDYRNPNVDDTAAKEKAALEKQLAEIKDPKAITVTDIDEIKYNKAAADKLWTDLGITTDAADAVTITFTAQADGTFKATAATAEKDGAEVDADVDFSKVTAAAAENGKGTGEGGVNVSGATAGQVSNVIFDGTDINAGDVFAVKFTNTADKTYAPKNIGFGDDSMNELDGKYSYKGDATIKLADGLTDDKMNADWQTVLDNLSAATIDFTVTATGTAGTD
ncbi:MAG: hypothetical protein K2G87_10060, partial [Oscillospiraceae bacterium]|nr:hypothetical protein [Oscillospiraceae bacterium]